jgi:hypothetical protein
MARVGRLKQGTLDIAGSLNERLPAVTKGLVAHYPFDGTLNNFNIAADIGVFSGTIADKTTPSSILGTYNVTASNGGIAFAGTVDSWVKLDSTPFGSLNDFRTEIGFILNAFQVAGGLSTIFHLANSGGNAFFIAVADNGSVEVHYNGQGYRFEAANTIVLGKYYDFVVKKVGSLLEVLINGVPMFSKTVTPVTLAITSGVLGQEQDVDYGGFQANQAFNGTLFYLKFLS